jgi:AraC family transcriptional activator of pobA
MKEIIIINSITEVHDFFGLEKPKHPLISVLRINKGLQDLEIEKFKYSIGLFQISLKDSCAYTISNYGRNTYDFEEGSMIFTAPDQVLEFEKQNINKEDTGWTIIFYPDLIRKSELDKTIDKFSFFSYASNEALHISNE